MDINEKIINQLVDKIILIVHPLKIILFGSAVRGIVNQNSDIDLLVVMPEGIHRRKTAQFLYRKIVGIKIPFDILVATTKDLKDYSDNIGLIYHNILKEGKVVYAA